MYVAACKALYKLYSPENCKRYRYKVEPALVFRELISLPSRRRLIGVITNASSAAISEVFVVLLSLPAVVSDLYGPNLLGYILHRPGS